MTNNHQLLNRSSLHPLLLPFMRQLVVDHKEWFVYYAFKNSLLEEYKKGHISFDASPLFWSSKGVFFPAENLSVTQIRVLHEISENYTAEDKQRKKIARSRSAVLSKMASAWEQQTLFNFLQNCTLAAPL